MKIKLFKTGPIRTNTYLIWDEFSKEAAIIDPAGKVSEITKCVKQNKLEVKYIINTHGHYDHILANKQFQDKLEAKVLIHRGEKEFLSNEVKSHASESGYEVGKTSPSRLLKQGDAVKVGDITLEVIETPGHSKADISLYEPEEKILFSGDTLFHGCIGRTDLPESNPQKIKHSLKKLAKLPDETKVYPGHGWSTTIKREKKEGALKSLKTSQTL